MRRLLGVAVALCVGSAPARAEFWPVQAFLSAPPQEQRAFVVGLIDMWQYVKKEVQPDPGDRIVACVRVNWTTDQIRDRFRDYLLADPGLWRVDPAALFVEAMTEFCKR